jgi:hypothetical protein
MAADAFCRGHHAGIPDLDEAIPGLVRILGSPASHPAARLAAARALVEFQNKDTAPELARCAAQYGADLRQIVEPALAAWNYEPLRAIWQARLTATAVQPRDLLLAVRCLAIAGDETQAAALLPIVHDRFRPSAVRSEAARAAGLLRNRGLETEAARLIGDAANSPLINRICAVRLIAAHNGDEALKLLVTLAADPEPAVAAVALGRLCEIAPALALPLAESAINSSDPHLRQLGITASALTPDPQRIASLGRMLDDRHPTVRNSARTSLTDLARQTELAGPVRDAATAMLAGESWRGLEQAALLLAAIDHKPAADRLVALLEFDRPEVQIAAAWGLKTLALPETLPAMLARATRQDALRRASKEEEPAGLDEQTAHLFEAFGRMKYAAAEPLLVEYLPKDFKIGLQSRKSAIWALGLLHAGESDESLAKQFMERVTDQGGKDGDSRPELTSIKEMSAIALGRMGAVSHAPGLRKYVGPEIPSHRLGMAIRWALIELTGESIPEPSGAFLADGALWFLEPNVEE